MTVRSMRWRSLPTPAIHAFSAAVAGGLVVVVGSTVVAVAVVVGEDAAVVAAFLPAQPASSRATTTTAAREWERRRVGAGMGEPPFQRGNAARAAGHATWCSAIWRAASYGDGAAAMATSCDDAPCPGLGIGIGAVAPSRRGPQSSRRTLHLGLLLR